MIEMDVFKQDLTAVRKLLDEAGQSLQIDHLREQLVEYNEDMGSPGFWDDPERAQRVSAKASGVESRIKHYESLNSRADDIEVLMELAEEADDTSMVDEIRSEFDKLKAKLSDGDTLVVTKLDRIARNAAGGITLVDDLIERGVKVHILNMGMMDNTPTGKLIRHIMFAFAEFERDMIVQRTSEGKAVARKNPEYREGRKPVEYDRDLFEQLYADVMDGALSVVDAAEQLGVSRAKWYRIVKEAA